MTDDEMEWTDSGAQTPSRAREGIGKILKFLGLSMPLIALGFSIAAPCVATEILERRNTLI